MRLVALLAILAFAGCATYAPPPPISTETFAHTLNVRYDRAWTAVVSNAVSNAYRITGFDVASGIITLALDRPNRNADIDCGRNDNAKTGAPLSPLEAAGFSQVTLAATANVTISRPTETTSRVQINVQYIIAGAPDSTTPGGPHQTEWHFTTTSAATQDVINSKGSTAVTCQPTYQIERKFLAAIVKATEIRATPH